MKKHFFLYFAIFPAVALLNMLFPAQLNQKLPYLHDIPTIALAVMMLVWGRTLHSRIIHAQTRRCLVTVSYFLFALFVIRIARWEYFQTEISDRLLWYLYYIPFIAVPLLSYHAALYLSPVKTRFQKVSLSAAWVLSILIAAGLLTNDLHGWLLQIVSGGKYSHGWLYYVLFVASVVLSIGVVAVLLRNCRLSQAHRLGYVPVCMFTVPLLLLVLYNFIGGAPKVFGVKMFYMHEVYALCCIGIWESCILIGLLPSNTGYRQLFVESHISAKLRDVSDAVWYTSVQVQRSADPADTVTQTKPISGGSITWTEDVHTIRRLREELEEANAAIEEENDLIEEENRIAAERTQYETQNRLYDRIAAHSRRQLAEIAESYADTDAFTANLPKNLLLGTYIKRCANLMLLADANRQLSTDELMLAIRETLDAMRLSGIDCMLQSGDAREYPSGLLVSVYDLTEALAESVYGRCSTFCASVAPDADTVLLLETDAPPSGAFRERLQTVGLRLTESGTDGGYQLRIGGVHRV